MILEPLPTLNEQMSVYIIGNPYLLLSVGVLVLYDNRAHEL